MKVKMIAILEADDHNDISKLIVDFNVARKDNDTVSTDISIEFIPDEEIEGEEPEKQAGDETTPGSFQNNADASGGDISANMPERAVDPDQVNSGQHSEGGGGAPYQGKGGGKGGE